jgi:hypothetical protein
VPTVDASKLGVNVIEPVVLMTEVFADLSRRKSIETLQKGTVLNTPQIVPGRDPRTSAPPDETSKLGMNVFENVSVNEVQEELNEPELLSEINEHMNILIDTYGRTTGMRTPPIEAVAVTMMMIVNEIDVQTDGIIKGNEPANMSTIGILMDLEQVVSRCTTSAASTVEASSVEANVVEPNVPMAADGTTNEVDADAISMPTTPESGRTTTRIEGLKGHRVHLPKSET